jgi:RelE-like HigB toxin of type II HigAB toxin-antitoxin system
VSHSIRRKSEMKLDQLDAATKVSDLDLPGNRLERLKGDRKGQYSIRINVGAESATGYVCERTELFDQAGDNAWSDAGRSLDGRGHLSSLGEH